MRLIHFCCGLSLWVLSYSASGAVDVIRLSNNLIDNISALHGNDAGVRIEQWRELMRAGATSQATPIAKLVEANTFFNRVEWVSDLDHWGVEDYWATPIETLATNAGDCEDYSIGKYFTLLQTQVSNEKLRIAYVKSLTYDQAHMVLAYYPSPSAEPLILDNINGTILPASQRKDLLPIYSFNGESIWLARNRAERLNADSKTSIPQWRAVNERFFKEMKKPK